MLCVRGDCSGRVWISDESVIWLPAFPAIAQHRKLPCAIASRRHHGRENRTPRDFGYKPADVPLYLGCRFLAANGKEPYGGTLPLASFALSLATSTTPESAIFTMQMDVEHLGL